MRGVDFGDVGMHARIRMNGHRAGTSRYVFYACRFGTNIPLLSSRNAVLILFFVLILINQ